MSAPKTDSPVERREWHVTAKDGKVGPLTLSQVAEFASSGRIAPRSLAWKSGMESWQPCGMIPELASLFDNIPDPKKVWATRLAKLIEHGKVIFTRLRPYTAQIQSRFAGLTRRQRILGSVILASLLFYTLWSTFIYAPPHDDFIAEYLGFQTGTPQKFIRIERDGGDYQLFQQVRGEWIGPEPMRPMEDKDLTPIFGEGWKEIPAMGLINASGQTALLRVPLGWESESFTPASSYFLLFPSGPVDLHKGELKFSLPPLKAKESPTPTATPIETPVAETEAEAKPRTEKKATTATRKPAVQPRLAPKRLGKERVEEPPQDEAQSAEAVSKPMAERIPEKSSRKVEATLSVSEPPAASMNEPPKTEPPAATLPPTVASDNRGASASPPPIVKVETMPEEAESPSTPEPTPEPRKPAADSDFKKAYDRASEARARLANLNASGRSTLKEQFLKNGDAIMTTSREREAAKDFEGAAFYAQRAEATFRQGEQAISGGR